MRMSSSCSNRAQAHAATCDARFVRALRSQTCKSSGSPGCAIGSRDGGGQYVRTPAGVRTSASMRMCAEDREQMGELPAAESP